MVFPDDFVFIMNKEKAMMKQTIFKSILFFLIVTFWACTEETEEQISESTPEAIQSAINTTFGDNIDLSNLENYANQEIPDYITKDNTRGNNINDAEATLGRVLFYDKSLSVNNTISCASCHQQSLAFGDLPKASIGVNGTTGRHSMRLVNARFSEEENFFWDERAGSLEQQTTMPIQDHIEMGFSGQDGDPGIDDLIIKLGEIDYYQELFSYVHGDENITEERLQNALSQFVRSIQSFDSKYDQGRAQVQNDNNPFPNFTTQENQGKQLFLGRAEFNNAGMRVAGGVGCGACHQAPEFDINDNSRNNGVIGSIGGATDLTVTRSPSLRDALRNNGAPNGPFMHTGEFSDFEEVLDHYNQIDITANNNLDRRLRPNGNGQNLAITQEEKDAIIAFIQTLAGNNVYIDEKWSDPFQ